VRNPLDRSHFGDSHMTCYAIPFWNCCFGGFVLLFLVEAHKKIFCSALDFANFMRYNGSASVRGILLKRYTFSKTQKDTVFHNKNGVFSCFYQDGRFMAGACRAPTKGMF
jgi:hypothetical protein